MSQFDPDDRPATQGRIHQLPTLPRPAPLPEISSFYRADVTQYNFSFPSDNLLDRAFNSTPVRLYTPGTILIEQDRAVDYVYRMEQGMVKYSYTSHDSDAADEFDTIISLSSDHGTILDIHCALAGKAFCTIELMTKGYMQRIPARDYRELVQNNVDVSWHLHRVSSFQLNNHLNKIAVFRCNSSQFNFEMILCEFIRGLNLTPDENGYTFKLPLKYWEIAQLMAISPEYLCRLIKKMEAKGLITRNKHTITVPDINKFSINNV